MTLSFLVFRITHNSSTALGFVLLAQALTFVGCSFWSAVCRRRTGHRRGLTVASFKKLKQQGRVFLGAIAV